MVATAPPVNPLMTRYAKRHQILRIMRATVREWTYVMHECRENVSAVLFTLLAERIPRQMSVTNPAPYAAIPLVLIIPARESFVVSLHHFLVRITVATLPVRKVRAARHAAGALRVSRHRTPPCAIKKALTENCFSEKADSISYFC